MHVQKSATSLSCEPGVRRSQLKVWWHQLKKVESQLKVWNPKWGKKSHCSRATSHQTERERDHHQNLEHTTQLCLRHIECQIQYHQIQKQIQQHQNLDQATQLRHIHIKCQSHYHQIQIQIQKHQNLDHTTYLRHLLKHIHIKHKIWYHHNLAYPTSTTHLCRTSGSQLNLLADKLTIVQSRFAKSPSS